ncbi:MAG: DUF1330 domain-containing protein [Gemmatimonadota bacterium]|nr:MAG: DUF1330 domain-containing protein [Gemmatimonadota bacterium]
MSYYFIAYIKIYDLEEYEKYLEGYDDIFEKYNGKVIVVDDGPTILEGDWPYTRAVVIRFPSEEELQHWYESPEYQALAKHRLQASQADIIIVKGRE